MDETAETPDIWQVWVETGGTFTDCIAVAPSGGFHQVKVLSSSTLRGTLVEAVGERHWRIDERWNAPTDFLRGQPLWLMDAQATVSPAATIIGFDASTKTIELDTAITAAQGTKFEVRFPFEAPVLAARLVTRTLPDQSLPWMNLRVGTTRGTNALLTKRGTPPAFFVTAGFADLLVIGTQQRPYLFARDIVKPAPLYHSAVEVAERLDAEGKVLLPLEEAALAEEAKRLVAAGVTTAAVALLHSYRNPAHERRVAEILSAAGFTHVSCSSELSPFIKVLPRAGTAVVNAYLAPIIDSYLSGIREALPPNATLHAMTSTGGLVGAETFRPKDSLLSGPAGGIVGAAQAGHLAGFEKIIAFDMGGTSTDVARFDGEYDYVFEHTVGDAHLVAPALAIESVAAGGGSICSADSHGRIRVGPASAGASPGPACYGAGGPLTITDVNLLLGRIAPERFEIPLTPAQSEVAFEALRTQLPESSDRDALLAGLLDIANERMADAIRRISVRQGYDPTDYVLLSFGGAGGQHACAVAERLGMTKVIIPPDASLLSAWGLGQAAIERFAERQVLRALDTNTESDLSALIAALEQEAKDAVAGEGVTAGTIHIRRRIINLRLMGQESTLSVEYAAGISLAEAFAARFESVFGYPPPADRRIEIESVRVIASSPAGHVPAEPLPDVLPTTPLVERACFGGRWQQVPVFERGNIRVGETVSGPALIVERHSVTIVEIGWHCTLHPYGALILAYRPVKAVVAFAHPEVVQRELFTARFTAIAEEMGEQLRQNSISTNVKERLDFSCALLGPTGDLVATAAHIPVHLGALGACVRRLRETVTMQSGEYWVTNHPAFGGSHLPDVTVVTPVYQPITNILLGYVASRAHHAEIGGTRPGSMPPAARTLAEEGVVLPPTLWHPDTLRCLLTEYPYPTRTLSDNLADLEAAVAANRRGAESLIALAEAHGAETLFAFQNALAAQSRDLVRAALKPLAGQVREAVEDLDDGNRITVRLTISEDGDLSADFTGTSPTHPGNLNAPAAVTTACVLYALRLLVAEPLPLNEGMLTAVTLNLPPNTLLNPTFDTSDPARCPAVVGGNTEISQKVANALVRALGLAAGGQGTMNNVLFGNATFGYYETVCGGAGATAQAPGASAVHTHMTNTRITDAEILERRYPVRLWRFAVRQGSGGTGQHPGGNGVVREYEFLQPVALSLLTQSRTQGGQGEEGGASGLPGHQQVHRADGSTETLPAVAAADLLPGDRLIMETPGGGGWGIF
jgi:5-oxoprolinase (ATP-hydrolysing)